MLLVLMCASARRPLCLMEISTTSRTCRANLCDSHQPTSSKASCTGSPTGRTKVRHFQLTQADLLLKTPFIQTEEVLLTYPANWWSVDGARLAYLSINNSATPLMEIPHFIGGLYPSNVLYHYPKVKTGVTLHH